MFLVRYTLILFTFCFELSAAAPDASCGPTSSPGAQACELPPPFPPKEAARKTARLEKQWTCTAGGYSATHPDRATAERTSVELCTKIRGRSCRVENCLSTH